VACCAAGCVAALGPGYTITRQQITVQFVSAAQPVIRIEGVYQLKNTGNQPLTSLELRLPGRRRFHFSDPIAQWDKAALNFTASPDNPRNVLVTFPQPWTVSSQHTLRLSVEYQRAGSNETALSFTPDAFFLPAQGWSPELLPARGVFATGGVPPNSWNLILRIPGNFMVHTSGRFNKQLAKISRTSSERTIRVTQTSKDGYPFIIAGRYIATPLTAGHENVSLWTHSPQNPEALRPPSEALVRAIQVYDSTFGTRPQNPRQLWVVECPEVAGCFTSATSNFARLTSQENEKTSAEMASQDTAMVDLTGGAPEIAAAAPSSRLRRSSLYPRLPLHAAAKPSKVRKSASKSCVVYFVSFPSTPLRASRKPMIFFAPRAFYFFTAFKIATARKFSAPRSAICSPLAAAADSISTTLSPHLKSKLTRTSRNLCACG
jgi:hypothetical protein